jgi:hypothetical protein
MARLPSVNDAVFEESVSHAINLRRYENYIVVLMIAVLNRSDARLFAQLTLALGQITPATFTMQRLELLLSAVRATNAGAYALLGRELSDELRKFVSVEAAYQRKMLLSFVPVEVNIATLNAEQIYAAAMARPFQGGLLKGFLADLEAAKAKKIRQTIAQGFVENRTTDQIIRDLRGTRTQGYADGLLETSRKDTAIVVRTALAHMAGFVQDRTTEANTDIIKATVWHSTLDARTTIHICVPRDLKQYTPDTHQPIGHSLPWLGGPGRAHWGCRSAQAYVLKSNAELGIPGLDVKLPDGTRASADGQVPAGLSYSDWLMKQSAARQDSVLGPVRGKMLRDGEITMDKLFNAKGRYLSLSELEAQ